MEKFMKLIKLSDTHYIVVDDSEIKEGDFYVIFDISNNPYIYKCYKIENDRVYYGNITSDDIKNCKKITHSTQPLEPSLKSDNNTLKDFIFIKPLSLSEVEEVIYGYNVENMAIEESNKIIIDRNGNPDKTLVSYYIKGFKAHQELIKNKLFTVKDIRKAYYQGHKSGLGSANSLTFEQFIQSLLSKTEWDVEFDEQGKLKLI